MLLINYFLNQENTTSNVESDDDNGDTANVQQQPPATTDKSLILGLIFAIPSTAVVVGWFFTFCFSHFQSQLLISSLNCFQLCCS